MFHIMLLHLVLQIEALLNKKSTRNEFYYLIIIMYRIGICKRCYYNGYVTRRSFLQIR